MLDGGQVLGRRRAVLDGEQMLGITISISITTPTAITIPTTGCPALNGHTLQSTYANITCKLTCNVDSVGYGISATSTHTISARGKTCSTINLYKNTTSVGVTWMPAWINTTLAME